MKNSTKVVATMMVILLWSCGTDFVDDPAGTCVTCQTQVNTTVEACADGDGNLTVITTDASGNVIDSVTSENTLNDFQVSQEGTGATCS